MGIEIIQTTAGIKVQQNLYIDGVEEIPISRKRATEKYAALKNDKIGSLRALTGQLNWVATQIRPDVSYDVLHLSIKLQKYPTVEDLLTANKTVKKLKVGQKSRIFFPEIGDFEDLKFDVVCDATHANLPDGGLSCQEHIILLSGSERCCPLTWCSHKTKRVVQSSLSAEALAIAMLHNLDEAMYLNSLLSELLYNNYKANKFPVIVNADNKSLHENGHSTKQVKEKHFHIVIAEIQEMLENNDVKDIKWIPGEMQLANCLTKRGASK